MGQARGHCRRPRGPERRCSPGAVGGGGDRAGEGEGARRRGQGLGHELASGRLLDTLLTGPAWLSGQSRVAAWAACMVGLTRALGSVASSRGDPITPALTITPDPSCIGAPEGAPLVLVQGPWSRLPVPRAPRLMPAPSSKNHRQHASLHLVHGLNPRGRRVTRKPLPVAHTPACASEARHEW